MSRYAIVEGDCRERCPKGVADRVNLGLLPSSQCAWETACAALRVEKGGILHVHCTVDLSAPDPSGDADIDDEQQPTGSTDIPDAKKQTYIPGIGQLPPPPTGTALGGTQEASEQLEQSGSGAQPSCSSLLQNASTFTSPSGSRVPRCSRRAQLRLVPYSACAERVRLRVAEIASGLWSSEAHVTILDTFRVKSFGPHVDHIVVDLLCTPSSL